MLQQRNEMQNPSVELLRDSKDVNIILHLSATMGALCVVLL